jgi:hypothetical protein
MNIHKALESEDKRLENSVASLDAKKNESYNPVLDQSKIGNREKCTFLRKWHWLFAVHNNFCALSPKSSTFHD